MTIVRHFLSVLFVIKCSFPPPHDAISLLVLVSLPHPYPATSPPQLQLLSRYVGAFGVDAELFGSIIKTFMSVNGMEWTPGVVCVFDGLENVLERTVRWYERRLESMKTSEALREQSHLDLVKGPEVGGSATPPVSPDIQPVALPEGIQLFEAEPIIDRKSAFVGRACRISDPNQVITPDKTRLVVERGLWQVPAILSFLMADRRVAKAAHPVINAWRCQVGNVLHQGRLSPSCLGPFPTVCPLLPDNDDDGESAAGGRLAHLLQILVRKSISVRPSRCNTRP